MKILIDIQGLQNLSSDRGIGRYTKALTKAIINNKQKHEIYLLLNNLLSDKLKKIVDEFENLLPKHHIVIFEAIGPSNSFDTKNDSNRIISELLREKLIEDISPDFLLICTLFEGLTDKTITSVSKYSSQIPTAVILYDLIPYIYQDRYLGSPSIKRWYFDKLESLKKSDLLLSISQSAKEEAINYLGIDKNKIKNISSAVDTTIFKKQDMPASLKEKYHITKPFLMHTSAYEERKNFKSLIKAFSLIEKNIREKYQLVLVCKLKEGQEKSLKSFIKKCGLDNKDVILTNFICDSDLIYFYSECHLFIFPSIHEGFGLPILEAFCCDTPVIGSNTSSMPEVIGLKEALFDPTDIYDIAKKIKRALIDEDFYIQLKENAKIQSKKFSWDKSAKIAIKAMEEFLSSRPKIKKAISIEESTSKLLTYLVKSNLKFDDRYMINLADTIYKNEKKANSLNLYFKYKKLTWRLEGPFDSSYSLSLLNREIARALDSKGYFIALHSTEGGGDFEPNRDFLEVNPDIKTFYERSKSIPMDKIDILSRNLYPPRVEDMNGKLNILHSYAWEESAFPQEWVDKFNAHLDGLTTLSKHVKKIMIDNGISIPLSVSGCGVDHWQRVSVNKNYKVKIKGTTFLHVSSCFPRKGVDILLEAYAKAFTKKDDVKLIIKTFKNPHNNISNLLKEIKSRYPILADIEIIEQDLSDNDLKALYESCDILVAPSRAEGFGLPIAEAMISGLGVITTKWGGQLDFCNDENCWFVDYTFKKSKSHFNLFNSFWVEPKIDSLSSILKEVSTLDKSEIQAKTKKGVQKLVKEFRWSNVAANLSNFVYHFKALQKEDRLKMTWISSYNTKCGIATYSEFLLQYLRDYFESITILASKSNEIINAEKEKSVQRCWTNRLDKKNSELKNILYQSNSDIFFFQFNFAFFDLYSLKEMIKELKNQNKKVFITFHSVEDVKIKGLEASLGWIKETLKEVDTIFVHSISDLNTLKGFNLINNVTLLPHGVTNRLSDIDKTVKLKKELHLGNKKVIASYGFLLPHKGIIELIEAFALVRKSGVNAHLLLVNSLYPDPVSSNYLNSVNSTINKHDLRGEITLVTEFLSDEDSFLYLDCADIIALPYRQTQESASGAIRYALAAKKPVVCTKQPIFSDVEELVHFFDGFSPKEMATSFITLLNDTKLLNSKKELQDRWIKEHNWKVISKRLSTILKQRLLYEDRI